MKPTSIRSSSFESRPALWLTSVLLIAFTACKGGWPTEQKTPGAAPASPTNLKMEVVKAPPGRLWFVVEGPFAICEDPDQAHLTIWVPKLEDNHYPPGLTAPMDEMPLGRPDRYDLYADYGPDRDLTLQLQRVGSSPVPHSQVAPQLAELYRESLPCKVDTMRASVSLKVPKPDTIYPYAPAKETQVVNNAAGPATGPCRTNATGCRHATKLVMEYVGVDLASVHVDSKNPKTFWMPRLTGLPDPVEIVLDVLPRPPSAGLTPAATIGYEHANAMAAMISMSKMVGLERKMKYPSSLRTANPSLSHKLQTEELTFELKNTTTHKDCKGVPGMFCQTDSPECQ